MKAGFARLVSPFVLFWIWAAAPLAGQPVARGLVLDAHRKPLPGARVELLRLETRDPALVAATTTDPLGRFALGADSPGVFALRISAPGKAPITIEPLPLIEEVELPPAMPADDASTERAESLHPPAREETSTPADRPIVSGRVLREEDGRPLPGALVWSTAEPGGFELTDAEGRYRITSPKGGGVWLEARAPGRLPRRISLDPTRLGTGRAPTFALTRAGTLAGRVVDLAGNGVAGAWVGAAPPGKDGNPAAPGRSSFFLGASTGNDGAFRIGGLRPGETYFLQVAKSGFLPTVLETLAPSPGRQEKPVVLVVSPARPAVGRVVDEKKRPVTGAQVHLFVARGGPRARADGRALQESGPPEAVSDARGHFAIGEIPALELDVVVGKPGFAPTLLRSFRVVSGKGPVELGEITLRPGASLAGVVVDGQGRPIPGASVFRVEELRPPLELVGELREKAPDATTAAAGRFTLADLRREHPVHLLVSANGFLPATVRGVHPPTEAPLRIRLEPGSQLTGRVLDPEGRPVEGAKIALAWRATLKGRGNIQVGPPVTRTASADPEGRFRFSDMPAGKAVLAVSAAGFQTLEDVPAVLPQAPGEEATLVLQRGSTLEGQISTTAGAPVANVRVVAGLANGISDDAGSFRIDGVRPGLLTVEAVHPRYKRFRRRMRIEEGGNLLDIVFEAGSEVRGRVVSASGEPVAGATAVLATAERNEVLSYRARTDADGVFSLEDVAAGSYRLQASARGYTEAELPQVVQVRGEAVDGLEIALGDGGAISGRILGLASDDLSLVTVQAVHESGESKQGEVDAAGNYVLRPLAAGAWLIQATLLEGQRTARARVLLKESGEETRDLRFGAGLTLAGRILYRNEPLANAKVSIRGQSLAIERSLITSWDGELRFEDLDADTYWLGVSQPLEQLAHNETVELTADREVTIRLERQTVAGRVTDAASEKPLAGAAVSLRHLGGPEFLIAGGSDASGSFELERIPPGLYRLTVRHEGYTPSEQQVEVPKEQDLTGLEVGLQPAAGAELSVRRASGGTPGQLHLRVISPAGGTLLAETRPVGSAGKIRLSTVPAGQWLLLAASSNSALTAAPLSVPGEPLDLVLPDAARLVVRVPTLATTDSIASLDIRGADGQALQTLGLGGTLQQQWQLIAGMATVEGVPAGSWILQATAPDGRSWSTAVATDGRADLQVSLE